jgi:dolichol kinase
MVRNISALGNGDFNEVIKPEQRRRKLILGQFTWISVCLHTSLLCYIRALLAGVVSLAYRDSFRFLFT